MVHPIGEKYEMLEAEHQISKLKAENKVNELEEAENRIKDLEEFNCDILGAKHKVSNSAENRRKELEGKIIYWVRDFRNQRKNSLLV